jgi:hypothetical protein
MKHRKINYHLGRFFGYILLNSFNLISFELINATTKFVCGCCWRWVYFLNDFYYVCLFLSFQIMNFRFFLHFILNSYISCKYYKNSAFRFSFIMVIIFCVEDGVRLKALNRAQEINFYFL